MQARDPSQLESSGRGAIVASTIIRRPSASSAFDGRQSCVVRLEEVTSGAGPRHAHRCRFQEWDSKLDSEYLHDVPIFEIET